MSKRPRENSKIDVDGLLGYYEFPNLMKHMRCIRLGFFSESGRCYLHNRYVDVQLNGRSRTKLQDKISNKHINKYLVSRSGFGQGSVRDVQDLLFKFIYIDNITLYKNYFKR